MTTSRRPTLAARLRTTALAAVLAATSFIVTAAPGSRPADTGSSPFEGIVRIANELFAPKAALAAYCASNPTFTGYLTTSTSSHPQAAGITDPDLYAWVSNVDSTWSCTAFYRFDGVAWNTTASAGRFDWGLLITSTSVACNYDVGSNDYIKGNATADCPDTDAEYALQITLTKERVYQQDKDHDDEGDLSFVHSDCSTAYGNGDGEKERGTETAPENFNAGNVDNRPGANCDPLTIDPFGVSPAQTITYDKTAPTGTSVSIAGGAPYATSQSVTLTVAATDAIAGVSQMQFSNDGVTYSTPQAYAANPTWTFSAGDGTKTVWAKYIDANGNKSAAVSDTIILDATGPIADIVTPEANRPVAGDLAVTGTAADVTAFQSYTLDYGAGASPASWTAIQTSTTQVLATGPLGTWSTGALAAGPYTLRLTVLDQAGSPAVDSHLIYVDNTRRGDEGPYARVPFDLGGGWGLDVAVATGEARLARSLFSIPSYGPAAGLDLAYSSTDLAAAGSFGYGWRSNLTQSLTFESGFVVWHRADGGQVPFGQVAGAWAPLAGHFERLTAGTGGDAGRYIVTLKDQTKLVFEGSGAGRLLRIENRFGKSLAISWGAGTATLTDASGRTSTVTFSGSLITSVLDSADRIWSFGYSGSNLATITEPDPDGAGSLAAPATALGYDASHRLTTVTRHRRTAAGGDDTIVWTVDYTGDKATSVMDPIAHASYGSVANTFTYNTGSTVAALLKTYSPIVRNSTTYTFDALGRTTTITDPLNHETAQNWYPDSTLESVVDPNGVKTAYTYTGDGKGNVETETADALGTPVATRYVYNTANDVVETQVADGTPKEVVTTEAYDIAGTGGTPGHVVTVTANATDPDTTKRQVTEFSYWPSDLVRAELDPKGITTTHAYDSNGNKTTTVANCTESGTTPPADPAWKSCAANGTHDATTNVTTESAFTASTTTGKLGLPDSTTSVFTGRTTAYVYDALGRLTSETPSDGTTTHEWDQLGNEIRTTQPGSLVTTRTLDLMNQVTTEVAPLRTTTTWYDATGAVTQTTTASDTVSRTYDGAGRLLSETIDPGSAPHLALTSEHAYDASGREVAARNADLVVNRTFYDADGRVTKKVENCTSNGTTTWLANDPGWKTCTGAGTRDATWNLTTTFEYDDRGNETTETAPNGRVTTWTYDDLDRVTKQVDNDVASPTGPTDDVTTEYAYDAAGHQTAVKAPASGTTTGYRITRSFFDALGRVTKTIENCTELGITPPADPAWKTCSGAGTADAATNVETTYTYDADGHRLSVTAPSPAATSGTSGDYLSTVTTRSAYDAAGRLCRVLENASVDLQTLADPCTTAVTGTTTANVSTRYTYDTRGNLASMIDARGNTTAYGYDNVGRLTSIDQPGVATNLTWAYDDGARTKTQTNRSSGTVVWTSDAAGRIVSRAYQDAAGVARTTSYSYTGSNVAWTATDAAGTISVTNDRLGRPTSVTVSGDAAATTTYGYNFTAPTRTDASGAYTMTVDKAGRITAIDDPVHTPDWTFAYGADGAPLATVWPTTTALTTTSGYDALGRLVSRSTTPGPRAAYTETYNRAGKRLSEASTISGDAANGNALTGYDPLGRLTSYDLPGIKTIGSAFDAVPNRTTFVTDGTPVSTTFDPANRPTSGGYGYDADGRMTSRTSTSGTTFSYDRLGRLAEVRQNPGDTLVSRSTYDALDRLLVLERPGGPTIRFRYAGATTAVAQVVDAGTGTVIRNVTTGPEGTVLADWLGIDQRLYGTNGHHDTTFTADAAGTVNSTLRYDPWGNLLASAGSLPDWRFQGSWMDTSTGLAWSVARWYDPAAGTFTSEDSLLGEQESPASRHLYAYANGDPVGGWDPSGQRNDDFTWPRVRSNFKITIWTQTPWGPIPHVRFYRVISEYSLRIRWSPWIGGPMTYDSWLQLDTKQQDNARIEVKRILHFKFSNGRVIDRVLPKVKGQWPFPGLKEWNAPQDRFVHGNNVNGPWLRSINVRLWVSITPVGVNNPAVPGVLYTCGWK